MDMVKNSGLDLIETAEAAKVCRTKVDGKVQNDQI